MPLIIEDENKTLGKKQIKVPNKVVQKLKLNRGLFDNYKKSKGYKRINSIIDDSYNKRSTKKDKIKNGDKTISGSDLKRVAHDYNHISQNPNNLEYAIQKPLMQWASDELKRQRTAIEKVKAVPPVKKLEKEPAKIQDVNKDIKMGNANVKITESYNDERPNFYDYIEDYDTYYVLSEFFYENYEKQNWGVLINPEMYTKALREFSRFGKLTDSTFPSKYVYQWMGIIMKNTSILMANTELAGHSSNFPGEEVADFAERIDGITIEPDYDDGYEWLNEKGIFDWMIMPDGSDAWSDYGLSPLWEIISEYNEKLPPEKVLVLVNRALDVAHCRGDLASIFIQGGSKTLSKISEEIKRNKKIIFNENQLLVLKEYHDQQVFNFDDEGNGYFKKNNWEHYVDYLESIGTYGMLPESEWDSTTVSRAIEKAKESVEPGMGGTDDINEYDYLKAFYDIVCQAYVYDKTMDELFEEFFLEKFKGYEEFKKNNNYYDECYTIELYLNEIGVNRYSSEEYESCLTDLGIEALEKTLKENFIDNILEYDMEDSLTYNDRGLIYMERNMEIPAFNSPEFSNNYYGRNDKDYYTYLINVYGQGKFGGIGKCFSWKEDCGETYCGGDYGKGSSEIKLKCWIDPKDVNWIETVYRNCYALKEEREIYVNSSDAKIEVFDVVLEHGKINGKSLAGKSLLKKPIIVRP